MGRSSRISLAFPDAMLPNRKPPASLLRPKPRPARRALAAIVMLLVGGLGGLVLGIGLQPAAPPRDPADEVAQRDPRTASAAPVAVPDPVAPEMVARAQAAEEARLASARQARLAAESQLAERQARLAAESQLAELRRELAVASAQRDALRDAGRRVAEPRDTAPPPLRNAPPDAQREPAVRREPPPAPATVLAPGPAPLRLNRPDGYNSPGGTPRVVIHHRAGSAQATEAAATMVGQLREAGFEAGELRGVGAVPVQRVVRYFHTDDAPAAARLAGRLGRGWVIQDFRSFEPTPASGLLEVWLPER